MTAADQTASLREHLLELLRGKGAHAAFEDVVADWPEQLRGVKPEGLPHTPWQILEHLRIAQWDIVEFSVNPEHISPTIPTGTGRRRRSRPLPTPGTTAYITSPPTWVG